MHAGTAHTARAQSSGSNRRRRDISLIGTGWWRHVHTSAKLRCGCSRSTQNALLSYIKAALTMSTRALTSRWFQDIECLLAFFLLHWLSCSRRALNQQDTQSFQFYLRMTQHLNCMFGVSRNQWPWRQAMQSTQPRRPKTINLFTCCMFLPDGLGVIRNGRL